jgi:hypothetical protein
MKEDVMGEVWGMYGGVGFGGETSRKEVTWVSIILKLILNRMQKCGLD